MTCVHKVLGFGAHPTNRPSDLLPGEQKVEERDHSALILGAFGGLSMQ